MIKLRNEKDVDEISIDECIKSIARSTLKILDDAYGVDRNPDSDLGGFLVILESEEEIEQLKMYHLDLHDDIPEYIDHVVGSDCDWIVSLYLLSSDYSITVIMPAGLSTSYQICDSDVLMDSLHWYTV